MILSPLVSFLAGIACGLSFAPIFFLPGIFCTSILVAQIKNSGTKFAAAKFGYFFGFGFYLSTLYWISFGVSVYIEEFWWALPFALFGLPAFLALFTSLIAYVSWHLHHIRLFHFYFCCIWVFIEWIISWLFTGLPWGLIGYALSNCLILIQFASIVGIFGLSFLVIYIGSSFYPFFFSKIDSLEKNKFYIRLIISIAMLFAVIIYGWSKLNNYPTKFTDITVRLVQPSIAQTAKWAPEAFWKNLDLQVELSKRKGKPDLIIWSEAALTVPYQTKPVLETIMSIFSDHQPLLLTGGVSDNGKMNDDLELYSSLIGINKFSSKILEYHKSHLVPFGEYMPLRDILPFKKITHGLIDYTEGKRHALTIEELKLTIWPIICYESIFPYEVKISNKKADVIVNITNDAWYGNSSGPYQHFEISRMRAIENGLPMLRVGNNGISAIIDPLGRVLNQLNLNEINIIDSFIPQKLSDETLFSKHGIYTLIGGIMLVLLLHGVLIRLKFLNFYIK